LTQFYFRGLRQAEPYDSSKGKALAVRRT
jgi:hypothetical protein